MHSRIAKLETTNSEVKENALSKTSSLSSSRSSNNNNNMHSPSLISNFLIVGKNDSVTTKRNSESSVLNNNAKTQKKTNAKGMSFYFYLYSLLVNNCMEWYKAIIIMQKKLLQFLL